MSFNYLNDLYMERKKFQSERNSGEVGDKL